MTTPTAAPATRRATQPRPKSGPRAKPRTGEIMTDITLTTAERVVWFAYSLSEDGTYRRPRDSELRDFGGRLISSSNDGASLVSCSPTDVWGFPDGSRVEIGCAIAEAIAGAALAVVREGDQTIGTWSMWTAPTPFLKELIGLAVENGEATAQDEEGCTVTAVRQDGEKS